MTPAEVQARQMSEEDLSRNVARLSAVFGWDVRYHTHDSRRSASGFPDWVFARSRDGRLLFVELKTETGALSAAQRLVIDTLEAVAQATGAVGVHVWRPRDWISGHIEEVLR